MATEKRVVEAEQALGRRRLAGICGLFAEGDLWYEQQIPACELQEKVELRNLCPVYRCAKERQVEHCGACPEFPCNLLVLFAAHDDPPGRRLESAAMRAVVGDGPWMEWAAERGLWRGALCPVRPRNR
ncbi:MAG: DUF3795 domain-containing protein [Armatimonadetes bacterium]|nr:DUF3795 domain-containing protein [Armatimonadota bacterium]